MNVRPSATPPWKQLMERRSDLLLNFNYLFSQRSVDRLGEMASPEKVIELLSSTGVHLTTSVSDVKRLVDPNGELLFTETPGGNTTKAQFPTCTPAEKRLAVAEHFANTAPHLQTARFIVGQTSLHMAMRGRGDTGISQINPGDEPLTSSIQLGHLNLSDTYSLQGNQYWLNSLMAPRFLKGELYKTETGKNLLLHASDLGLHLSRQAKDSILLETESVAGNAYSMLGRALCSNIEGHPSPDIYYDESTAQIQKLTQDPATDLLINIAKQVAARDHREYPRYGVGLEHDYNYDYDMNCYEAEARFVMYLNDDGPKKIIADRHGKRFICKDDVYDSYRFGDRTMLNLDEVEILGIKVPPGFIFMGVEDSILRPSAFCFDYDYAKKIFGRQLTRADNKFGADAKNAFRVFAAMRDENKTTRS